MAVLLTGATLGAASTAGAQELVITFPDTTFEGFEIEVYGEKGGVGVGPFLRGDCNADGSRGRSVPVRFNDRIWCVSVSETVTTWWPSPESGGQGGKRS